MSQIELHGEAWALYKMVFHLGLCCSPMERFKNELNSVNYVCVYTHYIIRNIE